VGSTLEMTRDSFRESREAHSSRHIDAEVAVRRRRQDVEFPLRPPPPSMDASEDPINQFFSPPIEDNILYTTLGVVVAATASEITVCRAPPLLSSPPVVG
jgi:hypothetical protein